MKEIIIRNQKEWDKLNKEFKELTRVIFQDAKIESLDRAYDNCKIKLHGSSVVQCMYDSSVVHNMYNSSAIRNALDSCVIFTDTHRRIEFKDDGATIKPANIQSSFETLLSRGILRADGVTKAFKQVKQIDEITKVYFLDEDTFCANTGEYFAHAKTLKMAVIDLRFKMEDRDTSDYEGLSLDSKISFEDAVICYRVITGACSGGVEEFLERKNINKNELTVGEIVKLTEGNYGHDKFKQFFN